MSKQLKLNTSIERHEISKVDNFDCFVCKAPIQNPRLLRCLHSFCLSCVDSMLTHYEPIATQVQIPNNNNSSSSSSSSSVPGSTPINSRASINFSISSPQNPTPQNSTTTPSSNPQGLLSPTKSTNSTSSSPNSTPRNAQLQTPQNHSRSNSENIFGSPAPAVSSSVASTPSSNPLSNLFSFANSTSGTMGGGGTAAGGNNRASTIFSSPNPRNSTVIGTPQTPTGSQSANSGAKSNRASLLRQSSVSTSPFTSTSSSTQSGAPNASNRVSISDFAKLQQPLFQTVFFQPMPTCECPICKFVTMMPSATSSAKDLPPDYVLLRKIDEHEKQQRGTLEPTSPVDPQAKSPKNQQQQQEEKEKQKSQPKRILCELCDESDAQAAIVHCDECGFYMCDLHMHAHKATRTTKTHNLVSVEDYLLSQGGGVGGDANDAETLLQQHRLASAAAVASTSSNPGATSRRTVFCSEHPTETMKIYCETCDLAACALCALVIHKDHVYEFANQSIDKHRALLAKQLETTKGSTPNLNRSLERINELERSIQKKADALEREVRQNFREYVRLLEQRERLVLEQLASARRTKSRILDKQREQLVAASDEFKRDCAYTEDMLQLGTDIEVLSTKQFLMSRLNDIRELCAPETVLSKVPAEDDVLEFRCDRDEFEDLLATATGRIVATTPSNVYSIAEGPGLNVAVRGKRTEFLVLLRDWIDQECTQGGDDVSVKITHVESSQIISPLIYDNKNGTYLVSYRSDYQGELSIEVFLRGEQLKSGSPYRVNVLMALKESRTAGKCVFSFGNSGEFGSRLRTPFGVAIDAKGNAVVADWGNHQIKVYDSQGKLLFKFGTEGYADGQLVCPTGVAVHRATGNIIVTDAGNHRVQIFDQNGKFCLKFGMWNSKTPSSQFPAVPMFVGVAVDQISGQIVVADSSNNCVHVYDSRGWFIKSVGRPEDFGEPSGVAIDPSTGNIFVTDVAQHCVLVFESQDGKLVRKIGSFGSGDGQFNEPTGIAVDNSMGNVIVADSGNHRVQIFDFNAKLSCKFGGAKGSGEGNLDEPKAVAIDDVNGFIFVSDRQNSRIHVI